MGFVTATYHDAIPHIDSSVFFRTVTAVASPKAGISKYKLLLEDGNTVRDI
jgi:endo-1,3(4)-beta-glucanase